MSQYNQSYYVNAYKQHEQNGNWQQAAAWRQVAAHQHGNPNAGHAQYQHYCVQQAYNNNQLSSVGQFLGPGQNPYKGHSPSAPADSVFQQYSVQNGVLYLGGKPY